MRESVTGSTQIEGKLDMKSILCWTTLCVLQRRGVVRAWFGKKGKGTGSLEDRCVEHRYMQMDTGIYRYSCTCFVLTAFGGSGSRWLQFRRLGC